MPGLLLRNRSCFRTFLGLRNVGQIIVSQTKSAADFAQKHDLLGFAKAQENLCTERLLPIGLQTLKSST